MNKSALTNVVSFLVFVVGLAAPHFGLSISWSELLQITGLFALSGGITNWLAVHMLFEKIPLIYGSGVIPSRFEDFKQGIKELVVNEFFTREQIDRFLCEAGENKIETLANQTDFDRFFVGLVEAIEESSMGGMLKILGGRQVLEPLKDPIVVKLKGIMYEMAEADSMDSSTTDQMVLQIESIVDVKFNYRFIRRMEVDYSYLYFCVLNLFKNFKFNDFCLFCLNKINLYYQGLKLQYYKL